MAVLELVQAHAARGAIVVLGNHDAAALGRVVPGLNGQALAAIAWTRPRLAKRQLDFLEALPTSVRWFFCGAAVLPDTACSLIWAPFLS